MRSARSSRLKSILKLLDNLRMERLLQVIMVKKQLQRLRNEIGKRNPSSYCWFCKGSENGAKRKRPTRKKEEKNVDKIWTIEKYNYCRFEVNLISYHCFPHLP